MAERGQRSRASAGGGERSGPTRVLTTTIEIVGARKVESDWDWRRKESADGE